jgi:CPA1 family monovalent cation:H+ antiporter
MHEIEIVIVLLAVITALAEVADKVHIPYPILLVIVGIVIGLIPGLPHIELDPEIVFLLFLPPLLYSAAWSTSWRDFKNARRPISLLALGCVLFTTVLVAIVAHEFIPGFSWPVAFVLGAIISPPDAVAATSVTKGLGVPRRVITILEGESLVNDSSGLIAYRYAVAAVVTGNFVLWEAGLQFFIVAGAGILIGWMVGYSFFWIHKITPHNPVVDTSLTLLTPFIAYLLAEELGVSGVLSVVTAGLFLSWRSSQLFSHQSRLQANAVWDAAIFLLNGVIFILIGLQLPSILEGITHGSFLELVGYGLLISVAVIISRILWVYPGTFVPRWISPAIRKAEPDPDLRLVAIVAWTGMRGVVSLAAALALPLTTEQGLAFPNRDLIIFLTFCVIIATLVFQGVSLPFVIKWLGIKADGKEVVEEIEVRLRVASKVIEHIEENFSYGVVSDDVLAQIKTKYEIRIGRLRRQIGKNTTYNEQQLLQFHQLQQELLDVERKLVIELHRDGKINEEVLRRVEYELDLEETRLILDKGSQ